MRGLGTVRGRGAVAPRMGLKYGLSGGCGRGRARPRVVPGCAVRRAEECALRCCGCQAASGNAAGYEKAAIGKRRDDASLSVAVPLGRLEKEVKVMQRTVLQRTVLLRPV